jgi:hypothetical protein
MAGLYATPHLWGLRRHANIKGGGRAAERASNQARRRTLIACFVLLAWFGSRVTAALRTAIRGLDLASGFV